MYYFFCIYYLIYNISDLSDAGLTGLLEIEVLGTTGVFTNLLSVDFSHNPKLNVSLDFQHLSGSQLQNLYLKDMAINDKVDFGYMTSFIYVEMDIDVKCVSSECSGKGGGRTVSWIRTADNCTGKDECRATCFCVTRYAAGLQIYVDSGLQDKMLLGVGISITIVMFFVFVGIIHCKTGILGGKFGMHTHDDFDWKAILNFCLQLWDFLSDVFLCYSIYDHWYQESFDSPDKPKYSYFFWVSFVFVFAPWLTNFVFLQWEKKRWQKLAEEMKLTNSIDEDNEKNDTKNDDNDTKENNINDDEDNNNNTNNSNVDVNNMTPEKQSIKATYVWLSKNALLLTILCFLSGGATASLQVVNSKLFGMYMFDMGLSRYAIDRTARHKLWLTVAFENVPQIFISILYARILTGFEPTVVVALVSSVSSIIIAIFTALLEYPKHYYSYQVIIQLAVKHGVTLSSNFRFTTSFASAIQEGLGDDSKNVTIDKIFPYNVRNANSFIFDAVLDEKLDCMNEDILENVMVAIDKQASTFTHKLNVDGATIQWKFDVKHKMLTLKSAECIKTHGLKCIRAIENKYTSVQTQDGTDDQDDLDETDDLETTDIRQDKSDTSTTKTKLVVFRYSRVLATSGIRTAGLNQPISSYPSWTGTGVGYVNSLPFRPIPTKDGGFEMPMQNINFQQTSNIVDPSEDWQNWTPKDVSSWIEKVFAQRYGSDANDHELTNDIKQFMNRFNSLHVNISTIKQLSKKEKYFNQFKNKFNDLEVSNETDWEYTIWPVFKEAIDELTWESKLYAKLVTDAKIVYSDNRTPTTDTYVNNGISPTETDYANHLKNGPFTRGRSRSADSSFSGGGYITPRSKLIATTTATSFGMTGSSPLSPTTLQPLNETEDTTPDLRDSKNCANDNSSEIRTRIDDVNEDENKEEKDDESRISSDLSDEMEQLAKFKPNSTEWNEVLGSMYEKYQLLKQKLQEYESKTSMSNENENKDESRERKNSWGTRMYNQIRQQHVRNTNKTKEKKFNRKNSRGGKRRPSIKHVKSASLSYTSVSSGSGSNLLTPRSKHEMRNLVNEWEEKMQVHSKFHYVSDGSYVSSNNAKHSRGSSTSSGDSLNDKCKIVRRPSDRHIRERESFDFPKARDKVEQFERLKNDSQSDVHNINSDHHNGNYETEDRVNSMRNNGQRDTASEASETLVSTSINSSSSSNVNDGNGDGDGNETGGVDDVAKKASGDEVAISMTNISDINGGTKEPEIEATSRMTLLGDDNNDEMEQFVKVDDQSVNDLGNMDSIKSTENTACDDRDVQPQKVQQNSQLTLSNIEEMDTQNNDDDDDSQAQLLETSDRHS